MSSTIEVHLKPLGCAGKAGGCLSFGLLNVVVRSHEKQFPLLLADDAMLLRNGTRIPWNSITRFKATDVLLNGAYQHTLYELWHPGGRVHFPTHRIEDAERVVDFVVQHVPAQAKAQP